MAVAQRIEDRMKSLGLSRAELARRASMPLTSLTSLMDRGSRKSTHLVKIARALETTPAFLTGETDDPVAELPRESYSAEDRQILEMTRSLAPRDRKLVTILIARLAGPSGEAFLQRRQEAPTLHDDKRKYRVAG